MHPRVARSSCLLFLAAIAAGCALVGGGGERIKHARSYDVTRPESWREQDSGDADAASRLPSGAVVTLVSSCGRTTNAPLDVLARQLLFGLRDLKVDAREQRKFGRNEGLFTRAQGTLSGTRLNLELFTTVQKNCVFDFSLLSPKAIPASEQADFYRYLTSFKYGKD